MAYAPSYQAQCAHLEEVLAARDAGAAEVGRVLLVEHDSVITLGRRPGAVGNLVAGREELARQGIDLVQTDRGGDITYHGPGQLVAYPILDLNVLNLGLHEYMRLLEGAVIGLLAHLGITGHRDHTATGVWVEVPDTTGSLPARAKICAMGVRVRRWVSMHGLALNVSTNLEHFGLIVPCGLAGRPVTSLQALLGDACPALSNVKAMLVDALAREVQAAGARAAAARTAAGAPIT